MTEYESNEAIILHKLGRSKTIHAYMPRSNYGSYALSLTLPVVAMAATKHQLAGVSTRFTAVPTNE